MKTIQFLEPCVKGDLRVGTPQEESYAQGQVVTLSDDQAARWIRRNKAIEVPTPEPTVFVAEPEAPGLSDMSFEEPEPVILEIPVPRRSRRAKNEE